MIRYAHIVIISLLICLFIFAQEPTPQFGHITSKDGLPENSVRVMIQDHQGYLWLGTQNGLVKYDGYSMKTYYHDENDTSSLSNYQIRSIFEDSKRNLWVGTGENEKGGLNKLDRNTDRFTRYMYDPNDSTSISSNYIKCIYEDRSGNLWIGTSVGLNLLNEGTNKFERFYYKDKKLDDGVYSLISKLRESGKTIQSILKVDNNARIKKTFSLSRKTPVLLVSMSEGKSDFGWLEDEKGNILFEPNIKESFLAGKNVRHRIHIWSDTLESGIYSVNYASDGLNSYNDWTARSALDYKAAGPDHPENWGIQVFKISNERIEVNKHRIQI